MGGSVRRTCDPTVAAAARKDKGEAVNRPQVQREMLHREFVTPVVLVSNTRVFWQCQPSPCRASKPKSHPWSHLRWSSSQTGDIHVSTHPYLVFEKRVDVQQGSGLAVITNGPPSFKGPKARATASVRSPGKIKALQRWYVGPRLHLLVRSWDVSINEDGFCDRWPAAPAFLTAWKNREAILQLYTFSKKNIFFVWLPYKFLINSKSISNHLVFLYSIEGMKSIPRPITIHSPLNCSQRE